MILKQIETAVIGSLNESLHDEFGSEYDNAKIKKMISGSFKNMFFKKQKKEIKEMHEVGQYVINYLVQKDWILLSNKFKKSKRWEEFREITNTKWPYPPRIDLLFYNKDGKYFCIEVKTIAGQVSKMQCTWSDVRRVIGQIISFMGGENKCKVRYGLALHSDFEQPLKKCLPRKVRKKLRIETFFVNPSKSDIEAIKFVPFDTAYGSV